MGETYQAMNLGSQFIFTSKRDRDLFDFHIVRECDLTNFIENYYIGNVGQAIRSLRYDRRLETDMSYGDFFKQFNLCKKKALENLFQEPIDKHHLSMIEELKLSVRDLYDLAQDNMHNSFLSILLNIGSVVNINDDYLVIF